MDRLIILIGRLYKPVAPTKYFFKVPLVGRFMPLIGVIRGPVESPLLRPVQRASQQTTMKRKSRPTSKKIDQREQINMSADQHSSSFNRIKGRSFVGHKDFSGRPNRPLIS